MNKKREILKSEAIAQGEYYDYGIFDGSERCIFAAMDTHAKQMAISFLDAIREYEHEPGGAIWLDERSSEELFKTFTNTNCGK